MKIIRSYHDYYDGVQGLGADENNVFVRTVQKITLNLKTNATTRVFSSHSVRLVYLGFCGQIYKIYTVKNEKGKTVNYYDFNRFKTESLANGYTNSYDFLHSKWWTSGYSRFKDEDTTSLTKLFHEHKTAVFSLEQGDKRNNSLLTLNPRLLDFDFQTQKDAYTAYQDISQYLSGVIGNRENEMVKISDEDKIHKHGFDKWSFRKIGKKSHQKK